MAQVKKSTIVTSTVSSVKIGTVAAATVVKREYKRQDHLIINDLTELKPQKEARSIVATEGRDKAIQECRRKVAKISKECRMDNIKYRDPHFDLSENPMFCLNGLRQEAEDIEGLNVPGAVRRVEDIFDDPKFIVDGIDANDIKQGGMGDCWFLAACATIANIPSLLDSICVARDEQVGVYGFIFFRDGEWISEVIDDQLFVTHGDYADADDAMKTAFPTEKQYIDAVQRGSNALHFAKCADSNETWLPLLEKAFAKAHGDYYAIQGGFTGEGVEDLTGGVTTEIISRDILDKDRFWTEELVNVNKDVLFACGISYVNADSVNGIITNHAYSVLKAVEVNGQRLVKVRNPWGQSEWNGPWSDGSPEWTAEWMTLLEHRFGDDGAFWMSYKDFLKTFTDFDRTRIFTPEWTIAQCWTQTPVTWPAQFADQEFKIVLTQSGLVSIVLQQIDTRYIVGLEGQYDFRLHFRVRKAGATEYFVRSKQTIIMSRSVNKEVFLESGTWFVSFRVTRVKSGRATRSKYISAFAKDQSDKFMHIARSYDFAFSKGFVPVENEEEVEEEPEQEEPVEGEVEAEVEADTGAEEGGEQGQGEVEADDAEEDTVAAVGLLVYAKDPQLTVQLVDADPCVQQLDPDDSSVQSYLSHAEDKDHFLSTQIGSMILGA